MNDLRTQINALTQRLDRGEGRQQGTTENRAQMQPWHIWAAGACVSFFIALAVIGIGAFT